MVPFKKIPILIFIIMTQNLMIFMSNISIGASWKLITDLSNIHFHCSIVYIFYSFKQNII